MTTNVGVLGEALFLCALFTESKSTIAKNELCIDV